jgi:glycosyltransferase involved in cell wall biosynthesis
MVLRGHEVRVIDYEISWQTEKTGKLFSERKVVNVARIFKNANHTLIRPSILRIPVLDYFSMLFTYKKEIKTQIREFKPDIIIGDGILTPHIAFGLAKKNKIKIVYYCIDLDYKLIPFELLQPLGKLIESKNIKNADAVISINEMLRDYTIRMGADPKRTNVIRAGIDSERYDPKIDGSKIRKIYGIKKDDLVIFFMGWIYPFSGLKEVALELAKIKDKNLGIKILIVGKGDAYDSLKNTIDKNGLDGRVILAGQQPFEKIPEFISAADVCVLPAYNNEIMRDIVPIKMYEYMAMGKPVISTKLPGVMKEFGENHGVIYTDKPEDILQKTLELFESDLILKEGAKARKFVGKNDWEKVADKFEEILEELI